MRIQISGWMRGEKRGKTIRPKRVVHPIRLKFTINPPINRDDKAIIKQRVYHVFKDWYEQILVDLSDNYITIRLRKPMIAINSDMEDSFYEEIKSLFSTVIFEDAGGDRFKIESFHYQLKWDLRARHYRRR